MKVAWNQTTFDARCSCNKGRSCEHVWASMRTAYEFDYPVDDGAEIYGNIGQLGSGNQLQAKGKTKPPSIPRWKEVLRQVSINDQSAEERITWPAGRELIYLIEHAATLASKEIVIELNYRERKKDGNWSKLKVAKLDREGIASLTDGADRTIVAMLTGAEGDRNRHGYGYGYYSGSDRQSRYALTAPLARAALPAICRTGRCYLRRREFIDPELELPQSWGEGATWRLSVEVKRDPQRREFTVEGKLEREGETRSVADPLMITPAGLVFWGDVIEEYDDRGAFDWLRYLRSQAH